MPNLSPDATKAGVINDAWTGKSLSDFQYLSDVAVDIPFQHSLNVGWDDD